MFQTQEGEILKGEMEKPWLVIFATLRTILNQIATPTKSILNNSKKEREMIGLTGEKPRRKVKRKKRK